MMQSSQGSAERDQNRPASPSPSTGPASSGGTPTFSVIICTRDRGPELERCLGALSQQRYPNFDVMVVDSAPQDTAAFEVARRWGVVYVMEPRAGVSRARNLGVRASTGDIVAFLDDDAVADPEWLRSLAAQFNDPRVAAVAGRIQELRAPGQSPDEVGEFFTLDCLGEERRVFDRENPQWFEIASFGGIGQGSNMAFRRSALWSLAGFDHRLGRGAPITGGEEHYAFFRLIEQSARIVYAPDATVYHPYPADLQALRKYHLQHLAAATGYLTFLFFQQPNYRRRLVRYVFEAMRGVRRTWRPANQRSPSGLVSRWRRSFALLVGPILYLRTCFERRVAVRDLCPDTLHAGFGSDNARDGR